MAYRLQRLIVNETFQTYQNVRYGHHLRGKPPGIARSLKQRLQEEKQKEMDPEISFKVDIGFPQPRFSRSTELANRLTYLKAHKKNPDLEKAARSNTLKIDLDAVKSEWLRTSGPYQIRSIAHHYGVYEHLFGDAYFTPRTPLSVNYTESGIPVYYGNLIKPTDAKSKPVVSYDSDPDSLWTLVLTNPDGNLSKQDSEYVHWIVANIPGNDVSKGETVIEYMQPFPAKGTGFQRMIFVLYKQDKKIDFGGLKQDGLCLDLEKRTFSTLDFYRERQDFITPSGLSFYQCDWDSSLPDFYHNTLQILEPVFEYDFPPPYIKPQKWFPLRQPFNVYMDKYRDPKKINEEYLIKKLKKTHPFKGPEQPLPYPNAMPIDKNVPSWLNTVLKKDRLGWGRINELKDE